MTWEESSIASEWDDEDREMFYEIDTDIPAPKGISEDTWKAMDDIDRALYLYEGDLP